MRLLSWNTPFAASYENKPHLKGELADFKRLFGELSRYAVAPVYTRFDAVEWFVWDAQSICPDTGFAQVIRQEPTLDAALEGLV